MIRLRPDEGRQERVVDVDDAVRVGRAELVRDDLHVARQHDEVDLLVFEERELLVLNRSFGLLRHLEHRVGHGEVLGHVPQVLVVRHDLYDLDARQLAGVVPQQQFPEAVGVLGHLRAAAFVARHRDGRTRGHYEDGNSRRLRPAHVARHAEAPGNLVHGSLDADAVRV